MSEEVKPEVIKRTQDSLKKFVKKPPLTEKLLKKPPFRFLHDLVTSIMKETGYLQGLYTQEELNPDNIKDRDGKIAFLEKLIAVVKLSTGANVSARPTKIVAGLEVEKTNELLQIIGKALEKKIDSTKAVEQVLSKGGKKLSTSKASKETTKSKSSKEIEEKVKDKTDSKKKKPSSRANKDVTVKEAVTKLKQLSKKENENITPTRKKERSPTKAVSEKQSKEKPVPDGINLDNKAGTPTKKKHSDDQPPVQQKNEVVNIENVLPVSMTASDSTALTENQKEVSQDVDNKPDEIKVNDHDTITSGINENKLPLENELPVAQNNDNAIDKENNEEQEPDKQDNEKENRDGSRPRRPSSARPGHRRNSSARRISDITNGTETATSNQTSQDNSLTEVQVLSASVPSSSETVSKAAPLPLARSRTGIRPPSARPGAPRVRDRGHVEAVEDVRSPSVPVNLIVDAEASKDEDDENLVVLDSQPVPGEEKVELLKVDLASDVSTSGLDLNSQEQGQLVAQILETQRELELSGTSSAKVEIDWEGGRKRERESAIKEVDRLRSAIQSLTRAANPLGKLIDFLQEDVDSMQREYLNWQQTNALLSKELQTEQSLTESSLEPLRRQLDELDQLIQDEHEKVSAVKANIIRNDERILKLLPGVNNS